MGELLARISSRELTEWMLYDHIEGLPDKRHDVRAGTIAATIVNVQPRRKGAKRKALSPLDFFPSLKPQRSSTPDPEVIHTAFAAVAASSPGLIAVFETEEAADEHGSLADSNARP